MLQISTSGGRYREDREFIKTKRVLGKGNCAGDIIVVKDRKTGKEHALKTVSHVCVYLYVIYHYVSKFINVHEKNARFIILRTHRYHCLQTS